ncbi:MAG: protease pro-enzyme activation domain-containing protein [Acidobacteriaceae bacterium]|nr:protease pro-enzyme activation domain-containing protein [Acidobacteriaceae bacterium]
MNRTALYRSWWTAATLAVCSLFASVSPAQVNTAARRITTAINDADRVPLASTVRPQLKFATDQGVVSGNTAAHHMMLVLSRSQDRQQALTQYLSDVQNPASPSFHKWLTPAQYGASFGAASDDIATISAWLQSQGFTVEKSSAAANVIQFSGNVSQVQKAFSTQIHSYMVDGVRHMANATAPQVPRAMASVVNGVLGLDDFHPSSTAIQGPSAKFDANSKRIQPDFTLFSSSGTPYLYVDPADAATIYDVPNTLLNPAYTGTSYDGTGVTVGVVGDSNVDLTPVTMYREAFLNETSSTLNLPTVIVDGEDPGINGDEVETFLDLEVLGGLAPKAKINYYTSNDSDLSAGLFNAIARAIDDNAVSVLSISYGGCEANLGSDTNAFLNEKYEQAAAQGITVTVSSGDSGAAGCDSSSSTTAQYGLAVNGLGSTPYNVSVGGTDYDVLGTAFTSYVKDSQGGSSYSGVFPYWLTALSYIPERPWNDSTSNNGLLASNTALSSSGTTNIIGGGGGVSILYDKPAFQSSLTPSDGKRDVPDVSFLAGNGLYGAVWLICGSGSLYLGPDCQMSDNNFTSTSTFSGAGGTSAATPAFAAMLALVVEATGSRLGQANNVLYQLAATKYSTVFHDVVNGNNAVVCTAGTTNCGSNGFTTGFDTATGYDTASGLGSVDAAKMLQNWSSVAMGGTGTTLQINGATSPVSVTHGTSLAFNVNVAPSTATGVAALVTTQSVATGTASNNGQLTIPLTSGVGSLNYNGLPGGSYTVYARYAGDASNASSSSTPISVNIAAENSSTDLWLNVYDPSGATISGLQSIPYGSYIFAETTVYGTAEGYTDSLGLATGSFTLKDNGSTLGTAAMTSGNLASFPSITAGVYPYAVGTHKLVAAYPGDVSYKANTSNEVDFTVVKGVTTSSVNPASTTIRSTASDQVTVEIETNSLALAPTGTITLTAANGTTLGTTSSLTSGELNSGAAIAYATFTVQGSQLSPGSNLLTAVYTGDGNYQGTQSSATVTLQQADFTLKANALSLTAGSTTGNTTTITAAPENGFAGIVNLSCAVTTTPSNATSPITCAVPSTLNITGTTSATGTMTIGSTSSTTGGSYTVTLSGVDASTGKVTATTTAEVTVNGATGITLSSTGGISVVAGATTGNAATITVTPSGSFTGTVSLACSLSSSPSGAVDPIGCALSPASVSITGTSAATSTLTVSSTARTTSALRSTHELGRGIGGTLLAFGIFLLLPARRRRDLRAMAAVVLLISLGTLTGCGGNSTTTSGGGGNTTSTGTTAGTYVLKVTATASGVTAQTTTVNVTVN